jgi:protease IV
MKEFLKYVLATIVGIIVSSIVVFLLFIGIVSAIIATQDKTVDVKSNSILYMKLDQQIVDRKPAMLFNISALSRVEKIGLNEILGSIEKAKDDPKIKGIHLDLSYIPAGIATVEEIRNALIDFRKSGKFVTVYSEMFSQKAYYLATAADQVFLNPVGFFEWVGLRIQSPFFKTALEKLDIKPTIVRYGKFKSAAEQFTETQYSAENSEQLQRLISTIWLDMCNKISEERGIPSDKLNAIADQLLVKNPQSAYELGLVDSLIYMDQLIAILKDKTGTEESSDLNTITLDEYSKVPMDRKYKGIAKDKIAIVYASGDIISGEGDEESIGSDKFAAEIRKARRDSTIKAVVVRVNSPGGSATASDVIWRELNLTKQVKPVIVSMGDLAASGGYYISCMADTILAQPGTIAGSIGVIGMHLNTQGFFNKFGISFDSEKTNQYADFLSPMRTPSQLELQYWQAMVDSFYTTFVSRVDEGRALNFVEIDKIGQGRVWSGLDAIELGLVDKVGGLQDAVEIARTMAGLGEKYRIIELPEQEDPFTRIVKELTANAYAKVIGDKLGKESEYLMIMKKIMNNHGILTRMPFDLSID